MANPHFEESATKVEEYYRNVYIYNNYSMGKGKGKGGKYNSRPYHVKGRGKGYNSYSNNYNQQKGNYNNYNKGRGKGKGSKNKSTMDNIPPLPPCKGSEKEQPKEKEREPTSFATTVEDQDTLQTS
eukprot:5007068-Amphidinium_carterae.1